MLLQVSPGGAHPAGSGTGELQPAETGHSWQVSAQRCHGKITLTGTAGLGCMMSVMSSGKS